MSCQGGPHAIRKPNPGGSQNNLILIKGSNNVDDVLTGIVEDELIRGDSGGQIVAVSMPEDSRRRSWCSKRL